MTEPGRRHYALGHTLYYRMLFRDISINLVFRSQCYFASIFYSAAYVFRVISFCFLSCILLCVACAFVICLIKYLLTYLLTYRNTSLYLCLNILGLMFPKYYENAYLVRQKCVDEKRWLTPPKWDINLNRDYCATNCSHLLWKQPSLYALLLLKATNQCL